MDFWAYITWEYYLYVFWIMMLFFYIWELVSPQYGEMTDHGKLTMGKKMGNDFINKCWANKIGFTISLIFEFFFLGNIILVIYANSNFWFLNYFKNFSFDFDLDDESQINLSYGVLLCLIVSFINIIFKTYEAYFQVVDSGSKVNYQMIFYVALFMFNEMLTFSIYTPFYRNLISSKNPSESSEILLHKYLQNLPNEFYSFIMRPEILICLLIFIICEITQFYHHQIFANMRKRLHHKKTESEEEDEIKQNYGIPNGCLFNLVSSPHYLLDVIMYTFYLVYCCGGYPLLWLFMTFMYTEMFQYSYKYHKWYQKHFPDYPKNRKALIPFIF